MFDVSLTVEADSKTCILMISGELDLAQKSRVEALIPEIFSDHCARIIVDISTVSYLDSAGIEVLISLYKDLSNAGTPMAFVVDDNDYALSKLDELGISYIPGLETYKTIEEAQASLAPRRKAG